MNPRYFRYYLNESITPKVIATSDAFVDAIQWSPISTQNDFENQKWEGEIIGLKEKRSVVSSTQLHHSDGYWTFYLDLKYKDHNSGEYRESTCIYIANNDGEVFVK